MPLSAPKPEANHFPHKGEKKSHKTQLIHGGINMNQPKTFNVKLTYNEIMLINRAIDDFVIEKNINGYDVTKDTECKILHSAKGKILNAYL